MPHWTMEGCIYHVVYRLRDSLPIHVIKQFEAERDLLMKNAKRQELSPKEQRKLEHLVSQRIEEYLDTGYGESLMRDPRVANLVLGALHHFDGERYHLHAWAIMPNHVHVVVEPLVNWELPKITHSWKSFTAHEINKLLGRKGEVWQRESYDHIVRTEASYYRLIDYVLDNPKRAQLEDWAWVGSNVRIP